MYPAYGYNMGHNVGFVGALISLALVVWFIIFSIILVNKLNRIIELLSKK
jgi:hypothetical protein